MEELDVQQVQLLAKKNEEMAERRTKEMEERAKIEGVQAVHNYNVSIEVCANYEIQVNAAREELDILKRDEERLRQEYKRAKHEFKEFESSGRLKSAFKVAKKIHHEASEKVAAAEDIFEKLEKNFKDAKADKRKKYKIKKKFDEGGSGIEKDWRLRQSKYGLGLPNSPAEQLLNMLAKNKEELERRKHSNVLEQFSSKSLLMSGDRNRNRVIKSSIDLLQPLRNLLILRRGKETDNDTKDPLKIPAWLYRLLPGGGRILASKYRWDGSCFPNSVATPFRVGKQMISKYDNIIEPLFGARHIWTIAGLKKLINNATDGGSSGVIAHGHRNSGKSWCLFHMGGHVHPIPPKPRPQKQQQKRNNSVIGGAKPIVPMIGDARMCRIAPHDSDGLLPRCIDAIFDRNNGLDNIAPKAEIIFQQDDKNRPPRAKFASQYFFFVEMSGIVVLNETMVDVSKYKEGKKTGVKINLRWNTHLKTYEPAPLTWTLCKTRQEGRSVLHHLLRAHKVWSKDVLQGTNDSTNKTIGSLIITLRLVRPLDPHHPVAPNLSIARRIAFCELGGFDIGSGNVKHEGDVPVSKDVQALEEIVLKIKLRHLKKEAAMKVNKKGMKKTTGTTKNTMATASVGAEDDIHFNLTPLTKIMQQYVGGGKLIPLRPTQTLMISCAGPQIEHSAGSARTLLLSSERPHQALHTLTRGYPEEVLAGFDFANNEENYSSEDLKHRDKHGRRGDEHDGNGNGVGGDHRDGDGVSNLERYGDQQLWNTQPWKTGIPPPSERHGGIRKAQQRRKEQRRSDIVTKQFNIIQLRRAFLGGKRTDAMKTKPKRIIMVKKNIQRKEKHAIIEEDATDMHIDQMTIGYPLSPLESPEVKRNVYCSHNNVLPDLVKKTVVVDRKVVEEELSLMRKTTQLAEEKEAKVEAKRRRSSMKDVEEESGQSPWPWPPPKDSALYGRVGTEEYQKERDLQNWLETLAEVGGYGKK